MKMIFLGPPGAGKGTMAKKTAERLSIIHISTGDLFRDAIANQTNLGIRVKSILDSGELVPDSLTVEMVEARLDQDDAVSGFIFDGFPRTIGQAEALEGFCNIDVVINFELSDVDIIKRLSGRRTCGNCGASYHIDYIPPQSDNICDKCGHVLTTRKDDEISAIKNRIRVYNEETEPLIKYYAEKEMLKNIDASPVPESVFKSIIELV
jgi:adenylate kinase